MEHDSPFFDSVCGAPVDPEGANQFFDGDRTFYFCSAFCRRLFLDQLYSLRAAGLFDPTSPAAVAGGRPRRTEIMGAGESAP